MIRLALGFVLAMLAFGGAAIWTVRQIDPIVRLGAPLAEVRTVELAVPDAPPPSLPRVETPPEVPEPETIAIAPKAEFVESAAQNGEEEPAPPPPPVVVAAEGGAADAAEPTADESAALIRRMLSVYRRAARPDRSAP